MGHSALRVATGARTSPKPHERDRTMEVKQVSGFLGEIAKLMHRRHLAFMERTVERSKQHLSLSGGTGCPENLRARSVIFTQAFNRENEAFKAQRGSDFTAQLKDADLSRDNTLSGVRGMLDALSKIGSDDQKIAAPKIQRIFDLYKVKSADSYEDQGIKLSQVCSDIEARDDLRDALQTCGLTNQMALLKAQNEECRRLVNARNAERSQIDNQAMNKARKETDAAYADFILLLNAYAITTWADGRSPYDELIDVLNADIDYYKNWVLRKSGSSDEDEGEDQDKEDAADPEISPDADDALSTLDKPAEA